MIEEDWGALEGSEWGSAPLAEAATVKPVPQLKKAKIQKSKKKKLKVLDSDKSQEKQNKIAPTQPEKKVLLLGPIPWAFQPLECHNFPIYKTIFIEKQE